MNLWTGTSELYFDKPFSVNSISQLDTKDFFLPNLLYFNSMKEQVTEQIDQYRGLKNNKNFLYLLQLCWR